ncbi:MAG: M48 family metalloprotease [Proteobacteria bacterium]|nr:M48 family metalloprotease [Pseudomonadota bacterium]MBU1387673.1 M48 family metalloprotease [Pseudomonadota bacterium]MBU1543705.1 M48 family metalloprotease [Pseudomonadota bacterium]
MFSNFLYLLMALIIYAASELSQGDLNSGGLSVLYSMAAGIVFFGICQMVFRRLEKNSARYSIEKLDSLVNYYISRLSVLALVFYSVILYVFSPQQIFFKGMFFEMFPTARAIIFIGVFFCFLVINWSAAFRIQKRFFSQGFTKKEYLLSNISFALPALLPWFVISVIADLLEIVPWPPLKRIMQTPAGEIGFIAVFFIAITIFGPVLIKKLWRCRPLEQSFARQRIEHVCAKAGLEYADILRWEIFGGSMITAGVMGLVPRFRYILVTPALLNALTDDELDAVMLHEIGHVQKYHMAFYLLFFAGFIACNFVFFEPVMQLLYIARPVYRVFEFAGIGRDVVYPLLIMGVMVISFILYFRFVFGFFMRNFERQADLHVYQFLPDASSLISTFYKIASFSRQSIDKPSWHHFSIGQRVRFLEKCQHIPDLIKRHHSRVNQMIAGYLVIILGVFSFGYFISFGGGKPAFETFIAEKILFLKMEIEPGNSDLYVLVGDYYYSKNEYSKAIDSYENVLLVDPVNVHALNNLAWLFATCPDKTFRDSQKALEYIQKALVQKREAFMLDTYAEALFMNNDIENAVRIAKEALSVSTEKKEYYQSQLTRFEEKLFRRK